MSVYINMEMPKSCHECRFYIENIHDRGDDSLCRASEREVKCGCPLIEVTTPHGRLIDADEFDERIRQAGGMCEEELTKDFKDGVQTVLAMLKTQTTIIPAEGGTK